MATVRTGFRMLSSGVIVLWAVGMTIVVACLMVGHWVTLPHPEPGTTLAGAPSQTSKSSPAWVAYHFLYADCACSRRVLTHVAARKPLADVTERLVIIGEESQLPELTATSGYEVEHLTPEQAEARYQVQSAPLLVVTDQAGRITYSGGYTSRKQGLDVQDVQILNAIVAGERPEHLPVFGCPVSRSLKAIVDPIGIRVAK